MKALITLLALITLASCGKVEPVSDLFSPNNDHPTKSEYDDLSNRVTELEKRLDDMYNNLSSLSTNIDNMEVDQDILQQAIAINTANIATLESNLSVTQIIDPCGDNAGQFDEVLLVMSNGDIIGYFEQGSKRFLSVLPNGNYRTTDTQACNFTVNNGIISY